MTPEQKAQLKEWLGQMTDADKRVVTYQAKGGHKCTSSTSLISCCSFARCQACHILHLKEKHNPAALKAYEKFARAGTLTWQAKEYKKELPPKQNKVNKKTVSSKVVERTDSRSLASAVSDDQLELVLAMLAERMKK